MTIENMITMHDINVDFTVDNIMGCDSFLVDFDVISNSSLSLLEWDFGMEQYQIINNIFTIMKVSMMYYYL